MTPNFPPPPFTPLPCCRVVEFDRSCYLKLSLRELSLSFSGLSCNIATSCHFVRTACGTVLLWRQLRCPQIALKHASSLRHVAYWMVICIHRLSLTLLPHAAKCHDNIIHRWFCMHALAHEPHIVYTLYCFFQSTPRVFTPISHNIKTTGRWSEEHRSSHYNAMFCRES